MITASTQKVNLDQKVLGNSPCIMIQVFRASFSVTKASEIIVRWILLLTQWYVGEFLVEVISTT